ncbi:MAG: class I SAM-dependent methyltransferase [Spirochaetaceae bacterium]|nr:class I SAM-dependent methyltransferase [Spirochaetaceae bacterium]
MNKPHSPHKHAVKTWSTPVPDALSDGGCGAEGRVAENAVPIPCALCGGSVFRSALRCEGFTYVRCRDCGLVQINPQPETSEVQERYGSTYGDDYLAYETANEAAFLALQLKTLEDARIGCIEETFFPFGRRRFLDVGCATGALLEKMRGRGWKVSGVEISTQMAEYGRRIRGLTISTLPLEDNSFAKNSFDVIHASHLIEHLNNPATFVREAHRILSGDGLFLVITPNLAGMQAKLFRGRWRSAIYDHLYLFSVKTLKSLLRREGFAVEQVVTWGGLAQGLAPLPVKGIADCLAKKTGLGDVMMMKARNM